VSELHRLNERRMSSKLVLTFADRRVSRSQRVGSPVAVISVLLTGASTFNTKLNLNCTREADWAPFHTYFSKNLAACGIETGPLDL
jgi:hypothetical protein